MRKNRPAGHHPWSRSNGSPGCASGATGSACYRCASFAEESVIAPAAAGLVDNETVRRHAECEAAPECAIVGSAASCARSVCPELPYRHHRRGAALSATSRLLVAVQHARPKGTRAPIGNPRRRQTSQGLSRYVKPPGGSGARPERPAAWAHASHCVTVDGWKRA